MTELILITQEAVKTGAADAMTEVCVPVAVPSTGIGKN
jgi:hypothetical protein